MHMFYDVIYLSSFLSTRELVTVAPGFMNYFDFVYMVWFSRLLSEIKQDAISHSNTCGFRNADMINVLMSLSAFSQLPEGIYLSSAFQKFSLG